MSTTTFSVATSTLNIIFTGWMNTVYSYIVSVLTDGGLFLFVVVFVLLAIVLHLVWRRLRTIFG